MKSIFKIFCLFLILKTNFIYAQSSNPSSEVEYCPNIDYFFDIELPKNKEFKKGTIVSPTGNLQIIKMPYDFNSDSSKFKIILRFADNNELQSLNINNPYIGNLNPINFKNIKSLKTGALKSKINNPISIPLCNTNSFNFETIGVKWKVGGKTDEGFGQIEEYEYLAPSGWQVEEVYNNAKRWVISNGQDWIRAFRYVNLKPTQFSGNDSKLKIRANNFACFNSSFKTDNVSTFEVLILRTTNAYISINNKLSDEIVCGDASIRNLQIINSPSCATQYEWLVANKGWLDGNGNSITNNIITNTPYLSLYPSCNKNNPPQSIVLNIKALDNSIFSITVPINFTLNSVPNLTISGQDVFCSGNSTYNLNIPMFNCASNVIWSTEYLPNHTFIVTLNSIGSSVIVNQYANSTGSVLLKATVSFSGCGTTGYYTKKIGVGIPKIRGWYNSPFNAITPLINIVPPCKRCDPPIFNTPNYNQIRPLELINTNMDITYNSNVTWTGGGNGFVTSYLGNNIRFYTSLENELGFYYITASNLCGSNSFNYPFQSQPFGTGTTNYIPLNTKNILYKENNENLIDSNYKLLENNIVKMETLDDIKSTIYPNPFSNQIKINFSEYFTEVDLEVYDLYGNIVWKGENGINTQINLNNGKNISLNLSHLIKGIYIFKIIGNKNFIEKYQILKK